MPLVGGKFPTFRDFASASLDEIYGDRLKDTLHVKANHLESGVWMNRSGKDGELRFEWKAFPRIAQIAPVFGIVTSDFNFDGIVDLHVVQNFYSTQPETGMWRGGLSQLMLGNGDGSFRCVPTNESGLVIADDGKSSALVDLDGDGGLDLIASQNNGEVLAFKGQVSPFVLRVKGGIGARLVFHYSDGESQVYEVQAGRGYLGQSPAVIQAKSEGLKSISVSWPDGEKKAYLIPLGERKLVISR